MRAVGVTLFSFLFAFWAGASPAQLKVGDRAPEFRPERLLNAKAKTLLDYTKGRVILYVYFNAAEPACANCIPRVHVLLRRYGRQGFGTVFVTKDGAGEAQKLIDAHHLLPAIALEGGLKSYDLYGFASFPTASVVGPDGRITWLGHPQDLSQDEVEKQLRVIKSPTPLTESLKLKLKLGKAHAAIVADAEKGKLGAAFAALETKENDPATPEIEAAILKEARVRIEDLLVFEQGCAEREEDQHRVAEAQKLWARVAAAFAGHPAGEKAAERAQELAKKLAGG